MFDYAKKIREFRERKFLTQAELAKILGVTFVSEAPSPVERYH